MKIIISTLILLVFTCIGCSMKQKHKRFYSPDFDTAVLLYNEHNTFAFQLFNKIAHESEDSLQIGYCYNYMGWMQEAAGDYYSSQESVLTAQKYLDSNNSAHKYWVAQVFNTLGNTNLHLKRYEKSLLYYDLAVQTDPAGSSYYLNNKAVAYQKKKQYPEAISIYQSITEIHADSTEYAKELSNLGRSKWLADSTYDPRPELWKALSIRKIINDTIELNSSYSHLADYYQDKLKDSALYYANQMYDAASSIHSADDQLEAIGKIIKLEPPAIAINYFNRYLNLNDSLQQSRSNARNQFAVVRFDAEKSKADNLVLQKDNADKKAKINRQQLIVFGLLSGIVVIVIIGRLMYKKREQRIILRSQHAMKEQELKTSRKVHDVVANGLYQVMTEIEHSNIEKEKLLDKIEVLYEKSRNISYETMTGTFSSYPEKINDLLSSYSNLTTKILIAGNNEIFWQEIPYQTRKELELVLQELMINMKKHSHANNVLVKFEKSNDQYSIKYTDDGIGIGKDVTFGNGLKNTGNRIKAIGGTFNFETNVAKGLKINIYFLNSKDDKQSFGSGRS